MLLLDLIYLLAIAICSPWLVWRSVRTGRYRRELSSKLLGRVRPSNPGRRPVAWFHAVSVGEVNLLGTLVPAFRKRHPDWLIVVSSTTDTGLAEARKRFADSAVIAWPADFSWAVASAIEAVGPSLIVLTESELWPNFLHAARKRDIPVVVVNARMSPRSFSRLRRVKALAGRWLYENVACFAVQEQEYADRLRELGVPSSRLIVTGSVKYDGAMKDRDPERTDWLRNLLGIERGRQMIFLAGSTHAPEEEIVLAVFRRLREKVPAIHLVLVPRHPDRFAEVARLVEGSGLSFVRRSTVSEPLEQPPAVVLLDTVGELGAAWGLADVGFTGGSLDGKRGGQSMIEPAGHGVACIHGPHVWNFKDAARRLVEVGGAIMVRDAAGLEAALFELVTNKERRTRMGALARELVERQQGATSRTLDVIDSLVGVAALRLRAA